MSSLDRHLFKFQSQLLILNLELAGVEEKPKRSSEFETTYKNESGKEIVVKRSPDGKFASKGGLSSSLAIATPATTPPIDPEVTRNNGKAVREILTGKTGDDLKKNLAAEFEHRPILKEAIEKVDFAEITKGDSDALTNVSNFMSEKFEQALNASSVLSREIIGASISVAAFVARSLAYSAAFGATLILGSAGIGVFKKGMRPDKALVQQATLIGPAVLQSMFSKESLVSRMRWGAIVEGIFRSLDIAAEVSKKSQPPIVEPTADEAVREALKSIDSTVKTDLLAGAVNNPGIAEGIKNTSVEDVVKGEKDAFTNAIEFMQDRMEDAVKAVSEHKKEIAIGAAAVACMTGITAFSLITGTATRMVLLDTIREIIAGKGLQEAAKIAMKQASLTRIKDVLTKPVVATLVGYRLASQAITEITKQVNIANGTLGERSFGGNEERVKKIVADEGLDYTDVLEAIARRKEESPNPKKAAQIHRDILNIQVEIQKGADKAGSIASGKIGLTLQETAQITQIARKEVLLKDKIREKQGELEIAEGRGFSLTKRLNEMAELAKSKEGSNSLSYRWRKNIVKAEIEYGTKLDELANVGGYRSLLDAMKKDTSATQGSYTVPSEKDDEVLSNLFSSGGSPVQTFSRNRAKVVDIAVRSGKDLQSHLKTPVNITIGLNGGQPCSINGNFNKYKYLNDYMASKDARFNSFTATDLFKNKNVDGYINIGDAVLESFGQRIYGYDTLASPEDHIREITWHETGHLLEFKLGKVEESATFREERAQEVPGDRKIIPSPGLSSGSQDYALGNFYSPYVGLRMKGKGKYANTDRSTEVLSSGMELLSSPALAKLGVKTDRETMLYALAAMSQKPED